MVPSLIITTWLVSLASATNQNSKENIRLYSPHPAPIYNDMYIILVSDCIHCKESTVDLEQCVVAYVNFTFKIFLKVNNFAKIMVFHNAGGCPLTALTVACALS